MSQRSMFFDAVSGDRSYDSAALAALFRAVVQRDGVVYGYGNALSVTENSPAGMSVLVNTGAAFVLGRMFEVYSAAEVLTIAAADPTYPRIDRIVVKLDLSTGVRSVSLAVKTGVAQASPVAPALQRDTSVWELSLAQVMVNARVTSILNANITDKRFDASLCGYITETPYVLHRGTYQNGASLATALDAALKPPPSARVYGTAQLIAGDGAYYPLAFAYERWDTDSIHDPVTNNSRLTCKTAGEYHIFGHVEFAANSTGNRYLAIRLNGTTYIAKSSLNNQGTLMLQMSIDTDYNLAVNDYVELLVAQTSGVSLNISGTSAFSPEFGMTMYQ